jgi:hypothetical protein
MGSIFIPNYRNGEWLYDENSEKIAVSSKSPSGKERGKHITTLTPLKKKVFLKYIHDKGYQLGKSEFKMVEQDYELKENEKWSGKKPKDKYVKREIEILVEEGLCNKYQLRDQINIQYFLDLESHAQVWPWTFKRTSNQLML